MTTIWQDLRHSARLLRKHPGFTVTAIGVLTLGIGVNAGVFGIINGLMIRPLAGADAPGEVVGVFSKAVQPSATIAPSPIWLDENSAVGRSRRRSCRTPG